MTTQHIITDLPNIFGNNTLKRTEIHRTGQNSIPGTKGENPYTATWNELQVGNIRDPNNPASTPSIRGFSNFESGQDYGPQWSSSLDVKLTNDLIAQIKGHQFNIGTSLGESRQTLQFIADRATTYYTAYRHVRRGRFKSAAEVLGVPYPGNSYFKHGNSFHSFRQNWLAYQYAWVPLMGDVKNAAEAVAKHFGGVTAKTTFRSRARFTSQSDTSSNPGSAGVYWKVKAVTRKQIIAKFEDDQPLSAGAELGLTDPFGVAWELVPFSFVVDWFLPIGSFLENAAALRSLKPGTYIQTTFTKTRIDVVSPFWATVNPSFRDFTFVDRVILSGPPNPLPIPNVQQLKEVVTFKHALTALALIGNLI